ncbi:pyridoxal phosphate-dependent transferase [Cunninghamella echinulata]|nr:pyridoxal phosphate-dependent transferase [Cunninghamella echinulata]
MINFLKGQPSLDLLPVEMFKKANELALSDPNSRQDMLQYGTEYGTDEFRNNLAKFLSKEYSMPVQFQHLCPTSGASFGLQHSLSILTRPESTTKYCYFQDPTYFLVFNIYKDLGFQPNQFVGIPDENNQDGLDIDYFETMLQQHFPNLSSTPPLTAPTAPSEWIYNAVLYCVPTHANPTGSILLEHKRQRLVDLARKYNVLIICDDVYDILTFTSTTINNDNDNQKEKEDQKIITPPKRLVAYDLETMAKTSSYPCVISNGSFSKILAPGCRLGWLECHETLIDRLAACGSYISGGTPSNYMNQLVNQMLKSTSSSSLISEESDININIHRHIQNLRHELKERLHKGMWEPIQHHLLPLGCQVPGQQPPTGGYFLWLKLPTGIVCQDIQRMIQQHQINISFGNTSLFRVPVVEKNTLQQQKDEERDDYIRLCFAHYPIESLQFGIRELARAIQLCKEK